MKLIHYQVILCSTIEDGLLVSKKANNSQTKQKHEIAVLMRTNIRFLFYDVVLEKLKIPGRAMGKI